MSDKEFKPKVEVHLGGPCDLATFIELLKGCTIGSEDFLIEDMKFEKGSMLSGRFTIYFVKGGWDV
jgi:hypothetical protein